MKMNFARIATAVVLSAGVLVVSCKKEDTTAPVITLTGGGSVNQSLPSSAGAGTWTEPGFTAEDDEDGDITTSVTVNGAVDPNLKGTYTVTYTATDAAGNTATETRTVNIVNDAEYLAGNYQVTDTLNGTTQYGPYAQTITASSTINNRIHFNKFADYANNSNIYANVTGSTIQLPTQVANNIGSANETHTFSGAPEGTVVSTNPVVWRLLYSDQNNTAGGTVGASSWFVKQ